MSTYSDALREFYSGEIIGEVIYSGLIPTAQSDSERLKLATLLQLETETKAWLRPHMVARGMSVEEPVSDREKGAGYLAAFGPMTWSQLMQTLHDAISAQFIPMYEGFADAARKRGEPDEIAVCNYMVEHEKAQVEFAKRDLAGATLEAVLEPVAKQLRFPLRA